MSDGFLARWSRRKRDEARRPANLAPEAATPVAPGEAPSEDEVSLSPEELAQLPSLDSLTAATDLTPFLRAGVPRVLRNAALRRMWSIDPAIRDFVSEAREYAYDWNTPGGVPGTGGAISAEDVRAMVEKVFGGGEEENSADDVPDDRRALDTGSQDHRDKRIPAQANLGSQSVEGASAFPSPLWGGVRGGGGAEGTAEISPAPPPPLAPPHKGEEKRFNLDRPEPPPEPPSPPRLRRHGGALPI